MGPRMSLLPLPLTEALAAPAKTGCVDEMTAIAAKCAD
jgi:hypothetical protein